MTDQPDPRLSEVAAELAYLGVVQDRHEDRARVLLMRTDSADRAAGIRRVTGEFTRQLQWAAWDDGYEAARSGQQRHNPYRIEDGS